jgi:hypothetical protein
MEFKALVNIFRFEPSSFTYGIILFLKPYASKRAIRFIANTYFIVSTASNKPRVICFGFQSHPKNFMTKTNTSCAPLDIHISKLTIAQQQQFRKGKNMFL